MKLEDLLELLMRGQALDALGYEVAVLRVDGETGEESDAGTPMSVEYNHETKFVVLRVGAVGC